MQAQSERPLALISTLITLALLGVLVGAALFERDGSSARAAGPNQAFRAHNVEVSPIIDGFDPREHARGSSARDAGSNQAFRAHNVEASPIIDGLDPRERAHRISASLRARPVQFDCQSNDNPQPVLCYGPYQIRKAYGVTGLLNEHITGQGSAITIIDAYGSPTLRKDLHAFDALWGLSDPSLSIVTPFGLRKTDSSWISETSLDVEWAHVMAPDAALNLVVARSSDDVDLYRAIKYVVDHNLGDVLSLSFGENETCVDPGLLRAEHQVFSQAVQKGMTLLAATGDSGSAQPTCDNQSYVKEVSYPAADPLVTAVGGTTLKADAVTGKYMSESAWNETDPANKASGGGYSTIYAQPAYQKGVTGHTPGRAVPDLALNASVDGGVLVYQTDPSSGQLVTAITGGTSVGSPELAGLIADGVQLAHHRLGAINAALYKRGTGNHYGDVMNDIISGDNTTASTGVPGYTAGQGWDLVTGWGSPKQAAAFLKALLTA